ncbi:MAG: nuclear transport factor 2 family protein [Pseudomonadales bacterium]|nr:nuclear transport factor 2 family protein [Pseudomonadales bacterium]
MEKDPKNKSLGAHSTVVLSFISACNERDIDKMMSFFDDNTTYHNIPLQPIVGVTAIRAVLEPFLLTTEAVDWVVKHMAETNLGVILTERLDRFLIKEQWLELPVMGVFEIENGLIRSWRDYFDLNQLRQDAKTVC